jgi:predicted RNA-binding protein with PUA-like domain
MTLAESLPASLPEADAGPSREGRGSAATGARRWLLKTEPSDYAYADLEREKRTTWDGVANNLALVHLRSMRPGDPVLVYHTGSEKSVVGLARVASPPRPDPRLSSAKRVVVDLEAVARLEKPVTLRAIRDDPRCRDLGLVRLPRLSVMPVSEEAWDAIRERAGMRGS